MSIRRLLVDRARAIFEVEDTGQDWNEGQPVGMQEAGPWFACRLTVRQPTEVTVLPGVRGAATRGYRHIDWEGSLLVGTEFVDGSPMVSFQGPEPGDFMAFGDGMRLEVQSTASPGDRIWWVHTGAEPVRRRTRVMGFQFGLSRQREPGVTEGPLPSGVVPPPPLIGAEAVRLLRTGGEGGL